MDERDVDFLIVHIARRAGAITELAAHVARAGGPSDPGGRDVAEQVSFVRALRSVNRIGFAEYIFHASFWVLSEHEERWSSGAYASELDPISSAMRRIEQEHGLTAHQAWRVGEGPEEWEVLSSQYDVLLDRHRVPVFREFGLEDIAKLLELDRERFDLLEEEGRRSVMGPPPGEGSRLRSLLDSYRREADAAERVSAYIAAAALRGAELECLLLQRCLEHLNDAMQALQGVHGHARWPRDPTRWKLAQLITIANAAGWLPDVVIGERVLSTAEFANLVRRLRNYVHPGRHLLERPAFEIADEHSLDARAATLLIRVAIERLTIL